ncbi:hypothetical protein [Streptomyces sp. JJ36]|uniref:hypothetical protein n=1 Tax=Streptomyces sp. JJ36 TaxID=2736645 RepID=UPI001F350EDC|nr:hypothetical protein [Streptomyces sp. JJ36]MCF6524575.1 hypothetical protein [Streptomyces sp. JJ36]
MIPGRRGSVRLGTSLVALVLVTACGSGGEEWAPPSTPAEAEKATRSTALTPEQWGHGFRRAQDLYEGSGSVPARPGKDCMWHMTPKSERPDAVVLSRYVRLPRGEDAGASSAEASTSVKVYDEVAPARSWMDALRGAVERCTRWKYPTGHVYGDTRSLSVEVAGTDDVLAWAMTVEDTGDLDDGETVGWRYVAVTTRKGKVVFSAGLTADPDRHTPAWVRDRVVSASKTMHERLTHQD